jgi:deoxyribodipyrimidine photo-lyase
MKSSMKNINSYRTFKRNKKEPNEEGEYVLYWMQINRRLQYNFALEYAVAWANKLGKPLLIYEALSVDYQWASDRIHTFMMEGMKENLESANQQGHNFFSYLEPESRAGKGLFYELVDKACVVISDEYPVFITKQHNNRVADKIDVPYITIDSNGLIPLDITEKDPYSAYLFRKVMQKHFVEAYTNPPKQNPLSDLENTSKIELPVEFLEKYPSAENQLNDIEETVSTLDIDHSVSALDIIGTRKAALGMLGNFIAHSLFEYDDKRNHPDEKKTSRLSPWLHFGKISEYEIVKAVLEHQPDGWDMDSITPNGGKNSGFFNGDPNIESFLDEVITWREVGFHYAHHREDYDQFESLPDWVKTTMDEHRDDEREYVYSLEELEQSKTHDEIWNAAQTQLREEGIIHNYLRMLWGKKIIEWTPDYRTALDYLIELNDKYAIDGRDPNSYSGIFWCLGRFDRAWQEREVFGKLRYMTSESTRKKVKLKQYLDKYGSQKSLM